jgi:hypothetical protein
MKFRILLSTLFIFTLATSAFAQFPLGTPLMATWQASDNEAAAGVNSYQIRMDADVAYVNLGMAYSYQLPQARLTLGGHSVYVRACADQACSPDLSVAFTVARPLPNPPRNGNVVPGQVANLTLPEAIQKANAFAYWTIDRYLTQDELEWLATRHPNVPPTRLTIQALMEQAYSALVSQ